MPTPVSYPHTFYIYRGDTFVKVILVTKGVTFDASNNPITTTPVDLTTYGDQWNAQLRTTEDSDADIPFEIDLTQLSSGIITLRLESDVTTTVPSKGVWDLQAVDTTQNPNYVRTIMRGEFALIKDVTRV